MDINGVILEANRESLSDKTGGYDVEPVEDGEGGKRIYDLTSSGKARVRVSVDPICSLSVVECARETWVLPLSKEEAERKIEECENWKLMQGWVAPDLPTRSVLG